MPARPRLAATPLAGALSLILLAAAAGAAGEADAGAPEAARRRIGEALPDFELRDLDGKPHRLEGCRGRKAVVLAFNGAGCPIVEQYAPRLEALHRAYRERDVVFLGLNASLQDDVPKLRAFAGRHELSFPILKDHDGAVAEALAVERTTEVLLLDSSLRLRYRGRVDDQFTLTERSVGVRKERPEANYLADAIEALLAGREVAVPETEALGCRLGRPRTPKGDTALTFHRDVEPILQRRCQPCHREGEIAPFPLLSYEDAAGWSGMIREVVLNRRMPPWHADPRFGEFSNDRSLPAAELETLAGWIDAGAPPGDPAERPPPAVFGDGWAIGAPDAVFEMPRSFQVPAAGTVSYKYFTVKTDFAEDRWVKAAEVRPGNRGVVHHILIFAVDPREPRRWRLETGGGTRGYFAVMVPGERPALYPPGMAKRLPAGACLVFQVHYTPNGRAAEDRSRVGFLFAPAAEVEHEVETSSLFTQRLHIPPQAERHEVSVERKLHRGLRLLSLLPHMHLRGESFRYEAHYPAAVKVSREPEWSRLSREAMARLDYDAAEGTLSWTGPLPESVLAELREVYPAPADREALEELGRRARSEVLLSVPAYDFGWQTSYQLAEPKLLPRGTVLAATAVYNNSPSNPALTREMWSKRVRWGDQTWDEMMIGYFDFVAADGE
jgi:peroxiredoxin